MHAHGTGNKSKKKNKKRVMIMKKTAILAMCAVLTVTGCNTYAGAGAYTGSSIGSILGSAIGGISGGPRGSDVGTIIGMAGGAIVGAAVGGAADRQQQDNAGQYQRDRAERAARRSNNNRSNNQSGSYQGGSYQGSGYQGNGYQGNNYQGNNYQGNGTADDRITFDEGHDGEGLYDFNSPNYTGNYTAQQPTTSLPATSSVEQIAERMEYVPHIEIRGARIVDSNQDRVISRGELCKVIFEVYNTGQQPLYDIQPSVVEATGNKQIFISPGMHVERLMPGAGIRYTAMLKAGPRLGDGNIKICLSVLQGNDAISKVTEFTVPTSKKKIQPVKQ